MTRGLERDVAASPRLGTLLVRCAAATGACSAGGRLYLVGGYPRDRAIEALRGAARPRGDLDLLVTGLDGDGWGRLAGSLEAELGGTGCKVTAGVGRAFPVIKVGGLGLDADVAPARRDTGGEVDAAVTLAQDLARRDLTVDALAVEIEAGAPRCFGAVVDPHGGLADVARGVLAAVGSPGACLRGDPLRLYRAVRLEQELRPAGFALDRALAAEIRRRAAELAPGIAVERVVAEVERALRAAPADALERLHELGLLDPLALPGAGSAGGAAARADAAAMLSLLPPGAPRSATWGALLACSGRDPREAARQLRLPRRAAAVATRLGALRSAAATPAPSPAELERTLSHRLTAAESAALVALLGAPPLDPGGRLARAWDDGRGLALEAHLEDARAAARAMAGGMPRRLALPRLRRKLLRLLRADPAGWLRAWSESGLLPALLPEVEAMRGVPQPPEYHAEGDVLCHTELALRALATHYPDAGDVLTLAVLLHDAGKPATLRMPEETGDRIRFHGHDRAGAALASTVAADLGLDDTGTADVRWLVEHHLAFFDALGSMRLSRAARVFGHPRIFDLLRLHHCDSLASLRADGGGDLSSLQRALRRYADHLEARSVARVERGRWDRLRAAGIDGWTLRDRLAFADGPAVGGCLRALHDALAADPTLDDEALWTLARRYAADG